MGTGENAQEMDSYRGVKETSFGFLIREHIVKFKDFSYTPSKNRKVYLL